MIHEPPLTYTSEYAAERWAELCGGVEIHAEMVRRKLHLSTVRAVLKAAIALGIKDLDAMFARTRLGNVNRKAAYVLRRYELYHAIREMDVGGAVLSYPDIAAAFDQPHSCIIKGVKAVRARLNTKPNEANIQHDQAA